MNRLKLGVSLALMAVALSAVTATSAFAFPSRTTACSNCHDGPVLPVTATLASTAGTTATYDVSAPTADSVAVFDGGTKIATLGSSGSFSVTAGKTYVIYAVAGPGTGDGLGSTSVSPVVAPPADTTAPVTSSNAVASYVSLAAIKLTATDAGGSGVAATYYKLDGAAQLAGTSIATSALGAHTLEFWSVDVAGNIETHKTVNFTVTAPLQPTTGVTSSKVTIKAEDSARIWRGVRLQGKLTPATGGEVVSIYVLVPGSTEWTLVSTTAAIRDSHEDDSDDDDGRESDDDEDAVAKWSYRYAPAAKGTYRFQVRFAGDSDSAASMSRVVKVSVR